MGIKPYEIRSDSLAPSRRDGALTGRIRQTLSKIKAGESFIVPDESSQVKTYQLARCEFGFKVTGRRLGSDKGYKFWRVS